MKDTRLLTKSSKIWEICDVGGYLVIIIPMVIALIIGDPFDWTLWGILTACCEVVLICIVCLLYLLFSNNIEFSENAILYYRTILSKTPHSSILYTDINCAYINNCGLVENWGLWGLQDENEYSYLGAQIFFCTNNLILFDCVINWKIVYAALDKFGVGKVLFVSENEQRKTINEHYEIEYNDLTEEQKIALVKKYCTPGKWKKKYAKRILSKDNK